jgi:hypothetical protein
VHLSHELARLAALVGRWIATPVGYAAALLLPAAMLGVADWRVRRRRK